MTTPRKPRTQRRARATDRDLGERVAWLEAEIDHKATKHWILAGLVAGIVITGTLILSLARTIIAWITQ